MPPKQWEDIFIGEISSQIVGIQYYDTKVNLGDKINFEREYDNPHDNNAIRVENIDFDKVGHLPKKVVVWLAPLIDSGKISIEGVVSDGENYSKEETKYSIPIILKIFLNHKGRNIFHEIRRPQNELSALHEIIRQAFRNTDKFDNPEIIIPLGDKLSNILKHDVLPETHLLLSLFPYKSKYLKDTRNKAILDKIREKISEIVIGDTIHYKNLTVFPIISGNGKKSSFTLLDKAIRNGKAKAGEIDIGGSVKTVNLINHGVKSILLPEGEILVGAKQNRVINISIIVKAHSTVAVPVSCVEQGRWNYQSKTFSAGQFAPPRVRSVKVRSVIDNYQDCGNFESNQHNVWAEVSHILSETETESGTSNIMDSYEKVRDEIIDYKNELKIPENSCGAIFGSDGKIIGFDLFDTSETFQEYWDKLSEAYFTEAILKKVSGKKTSISNANDLLKEISSNISINENQVGNGLGFFIESERYSGTGVWFGEEICHLSAFQLSDKDLIEIT